jgi:AcrR family transcriptional regulator
LSRPYKQKKRAESQAETRQRIVEAAVDLHTTLGPARTTLSMVAENAGVQRHTLYAHFPDERALFAACSALAMERDPLPDTAPWRVIADRGERVRAVLTALYAWYGRNADLSASVLRDAEYHALTRETVERTMGPAFEAYEEVLRAGMNAKQRAMLQLALSFHTWRSLVQTSGLKPAAAVEAMVELVVGVRAKE